LLQTGDDGESKRNLLEEAKKAVAKSIGLYERAFLRWHNAAPVNHLDHEFRSEGRLVVGLGIKSVIETGLRMHHTYGVPLIPGSALKGLASHYCALTRGPIDDAFAADGAAFALIFGNNEASGLVSFDDAWIHPSSLTNSEGLLLDAMTPHHSDYYTGKQEDAAPADFDGPIPLQFLSVKGTFLVRVWADVDGLEARKLLTISMTLLTEALKNWGIGGKTNSGYGKLVLNS
jgi:CRISPR-associated protein Cmr6